MATYKSGYPSPLKSSRQGIVSLGSVTVCFLNRGSAFWMYLPSGNCCRNKLTGLPTPCATRDEKSAGKPSSVYTSSNITGHGQWNFGLTISAGLLIIIVGVFYGDFIGGTEIGTPVINGCFHGMYYLVAWKAFSLMKAPMFWLCFKPVAE